MRTYLAIALSMLIPVHAFAGEPMSIDDMKAALIGNSLSGKTEGGDDYIA